MLAAARFVCVDVYKHHIEPYICLLENYGKLWQNCKKEMNLFETTQNDRHDERQRRRIDTMHERRLCQRIQRRAAISAIRSREFTTSTV
jgi:hypothetical protein